MAHKLKQFLTVRLAFSDCSYEILMYLITGGLTTLISLASFYVFATTFSFDYRVANFLSWVLAVLFAYVTNRVFVFQSHQQGAENIVKELLAFTSWRVVSLIVETIVLIALVELLQWQTFLAKALATILVLLLNYLFSKFLVFNKPTQH